MKRDVRRTDGPSKDISIVIPAWNEEDVIGETLRSYLDHFSNSYDVEILVVTDGCTDRTEEIVDGFSGDFPQVRHLTFSRKLGKGGGVKEGFKAASGRLIGFTDADGSTSPEEMDKLIRAMDHWDGVIGSRWIPGAEVLKEESLGRKLASRGFNLLVRSMFFMPFTDTQCGAKVFRGNVIKDVVNEVGINNFAFDVDLLYRIMDRGYRIKEVPIRWSHDENSSLNVKKVVPRMFISMIGLRMKTSSLWKYVPKGLVNAVYRRIRDD